MDNFIISGATSLQLQAYSLQHWAILRLCLYDCVAGVSKVVSVIAQLGPAESALKALTATPAAVVYETRPSQTALRAYVQPWREGEPMVAKKTLI